MPPPRSNKISGSQTEGAREIRRSFFCDLCQKGYGRSNELEAHENSYDHQHKKRLKEMKAMTRQVPTSTKRKEKSEMISLNLQSSEGANRSSTTTSASTSRPNKPLGFSDALRKEPAPLETAAVTTDPKTGNAESEEKYVERPLMWDELDEADGMLDLSGRPAELQKIVDGHASYMQHRQGILVDDVWRRIEEMKAQSIKS